MKKSGFQDRYSRNFNSISLEEQKKLKNSKVAVIGLGGLGGSVCEMLARVGIGSLILIDGDSFEPSNLNRQILSKEALMDFPKARAAKKRVNAINSQVNVSCFSEYLDKSNMYEYIKNVDLAVDCLDSIESRFFLQDAAKKASIPVVAGAIAGMTGQVTAIFPGDTGYKAIYGERRGEGEKGVETITGNLVCCVFFVASLQVSEVLKILLDRQEILRNKLLVSELWSNTFEIMDLI